MKPDTPILMITLQVPLVEGIGPEQILELMGMQLAEALEQIRRGPEAVGEEDDETEDETEEAEALAEGGARSEETREPYTDPLMPDLLAQLGYTAQGA